jgi:hypothetical protein
MAKRANGHAVSNGNKKRKTEKKQILLNAFDMSTVGHLSPGQWKVSRKIHLPFTKSSQKAEPERSLSAQEKAELLD